MGKILSTLMIVKARYVAYRVATANKSSGETKRSFNTQKKEHINYIKHFHPENMH